MSDAAEPIVETPKLVDLIGISPRETTELRKVGALVPAAGRGRWKLRSSVQSYCQHLRRLVELKASDAAALNKELVAKKIIKTAAEGELARLRVDEQKRILINAAETREVGIKIGAMLTARLQALAAEAAGACAGLDERHLHKALRDRIESILREVQSDLETAVDKVSLSE